MNAFKWPLIFGCSFVIGAICPESALAQNDYCTATALPDPVPPSWTHEVEIFPEGRYLKDFRYGWPPKRTWCFVRNQGEAAYTQCVLDPRVRCVDGDYWVMNWKPEGGGSFLRVTNEHTKKTRELMLISER